ncbi:MAG: DUF3638 domain-containing protein [Deltaproteobacteria bacterium]|nr:DUF3638 domain-containing protein [Deltaproteobacteria bacterium]
MLSSIKLELVKLLLFVSTQVFTMRTETLAAVPARADSTGQQCALKYHDAFQKTRKLVDEILKKSELGTITCWDNGHKSQVLGLVQSLSLLLPDSFGLGSRNLDEIEREYDKLQFELSYCRSSEITKITPEFKEKLDGIFARREIVPNQILVHLLGDVFGKGTDFEGVKSAGTDHLELRNTIQQKIASTLASQTFIADMDQVAPCQTSLLNPRKEGQPQSNTVIPDFDVSLLNKLVAQGEDAIRLSKTLKTKTLRDFIEAFTSNVSTLGDYESFYFQGGWRGHAVTFAVKREGESFTLRVFNAGQGAEYNIHANASVGYTPVLPYLEVTQVSGPHLTDYFFLQNLYDFGSVNGGDMAVFDQKLQASVQNYLKGTVTTLGYTVGDLLSPQVSGTCGYYTVPLYHKVLLKEELGPEDHLIEAKRVVFEHWINTAFFNYYIDAVETRPTETPHDLVATLDLAKSSWLFLNEKISSESEKGAYDVGFNRLVSEKSDKIRSVFEHLKARSDRFKHSGNAVEVHPAVQTDTSIWDKIENVDLIRQQELKFAEMKKVGGLVDEVDRWQPNATNMLAQLQSFVNTIESWHLDPKRDYDPSFHRAIEAIEAIRLIILKLPIQCTEQECLWRDLFLGSKESTERMDSLSSLLFKLSDEYFWAIQVAIDYHNYSATIVDFLAQLRLYAVTDCATNQFMSQTQQKRLRGKAFDLKFQFLFDYYLFSFRFSKFILSIKMPVWYESWAEMKDYWSKVPVRDPYPYKEAWASEPTPFLLDESRFLFDSIFHPSETDRANDKSSYINPTRPTKGVWLPKEINFLLSYSDVLKKESAFFENEASDIELALRLLRQDPIYVEGSSEADRVPKFFYDIRSIVVLTILYVNSTLFLKKSARQKLDKSEPIALKVEAERKPQFSRLMLLSLFHGVTSDDLRGWEPFLAGDLGKTSLDELIYSWEWGPKFRSLEFQPRDDWDRKHGKVTNYVEIKRADSEPVTLEEQRSLLHVMSIATERLRNAISLYEKSPYLLRSRDHQIVLESLLFYPGLIRQDYLRNQNIVFTFASFIKENYFLYKHSDLKLASYFLRLNHLAREHFEVIDPKLGSNFLNSRQEYIWLIENSVSPGLDEEVGFKNLLFTGLLRTYSVQSFANDEDLAWFLIAQFYRKMYLSKEVSTNEKFIENEIAGLMIRRRPEIETLMRSKPPALNQLAQYFWKSDPKLPWNVDSPLYSQGPLTLDLHNLKATIDGKELSRLPDEIRFHPIFKEQVDWDSRNPVLALGGETFQVSDRAGRAFRVRLGTEGINLDGKWHDVWYRLLSHSDREKISDKRVRDFSGFALWKNFDGRDLLVTETKTGEPVASLRSNGDGYRRSDQPELLLMQAQAFPELQIDPDFTFIWGDKGGNIHQLDYPRFGLRFTRDHQGRLYCEQLLGFYLADDQNLSELSQFPHHLVLDDGSSQAKFAIFPRFFLDREKTIGRDFIIERDLSTYTDKQRAEVSSDKPERQFGYYIYKIKEGSLHPQHQSGKTYLAYLQGLNREYGKALELLRQFGFSSDEFSEIVKDELMWVLALKDFEPRALALKVQATINLGLNASFFNYDIESLLHSFNVRLGKQPIDVDGIYKSWLQVGERIGPQFYPRPEHELKVFGKSMPAARSAELGKLKVEVTLQEGTKPGTVIDRVAFLEKLTSPNLFLSLKFSSGIYNGPTFFGNFPEFFRYAASLSAPINEEIIEDIFKREFSDFFALSSVPEDKAKKQAFFRELFLNYLDYIQNVVDHELGFFIRSVALAEHTQRLELTKLQTAFERIRDSAGTPGDQLNALRNELRDLLVPFFDKVQAQTVTSIVPEPRVEPIAVKEEWKRNLWKKEENTNYDPAVSIPSYSPHAQYLISQPVVSEQALEEIFEKREQTEKPGRIALANFLANAAKDATDAFVGRYIGAIADRLAHFKSKSTNVYRIKNPNSLSNLATKFEQSIGKLQPDIAQIGKKVTEIFSELPTDAFERARRILRVNAGIEENPLLHEILFLYARQDIETLFNLNSYLSAERIRTALSLVNEYLAKASYLNHVAQIKDEASHLLNHSVNNEELLSTEIEKFWNLATRTRSYDVDRNPDLLVFETFMGFLLRKEQIKNIADMDLDAKLRERPDSLGSILEMKMGSGKTSVLLPILATRLARKKHLSVVVMPEPLIASVSQEFGGIVGKVFDQYVDVITIDRGNMREEEKLRILRERIKLDWEHEKIIFMTNASLQSLYLLLLENIKFGASGAVDELTHILNLFRERAIVMIDEVDFVLDITRSHRFTLGGGIEIEPNVVDAVFALYYTLLSHGELKRYLTLPFTPKEYHEVIKPRLMDRLIQILKSGEGSERLFFGTNVVNYLNRSADPVSADWLRKFFTSSNFEELTDLLEKVTDETVKIFFATIYREIHSVLPLTLGKIHKVHYGLYPEERCSDAAKSCPRVLAIPYHAGKPVITSRFGSELESLNYSIQSHLLENRSYVLLFEFLKSAKVRALKGELNIDKFADEIRFVVPAKRLDSLLRMVSLQDDDISPDLIAFANLAIANDPFKILFLAKAPLSWFIKQFPLQLTADSYAYPIMFKHIQGMSGTLWNRQTFPQFFDREILSDTIENSLAIIADKREESVAIVSNLFASQNIDKRLDQMMSTGDCSLIDMAGFFKGYETTDLAKALIFHANTRDSFNNVLAYNVTNKIVVFNRDKERFTDYEKNRLDREETCAFWDLQHTTGSDLKVNRHTQALLTVGRSNTLRDFLQAIWRLRDLDSTQSFRIVLAKEEFDFVRSVLMNEYRDLKIGDELSWQELILFLATNEANILSDQSLRAVKSELKSLLVKPVFASFLATHEYDYESVKSLFEVNMTKNIAKSYLSPQQLTDSKKVLQREWDRQLASNVFIEQGGQTGRDEWIEKEGNRVLLEASNKVKQRVLGFEQGEDYNLEQEVELSQEQEQEQSQEQEQEQEQEHSTHERDAILQPIEYVDFQSAYFQSYLNAPVRLDSGNPPAHPFLFLRDAIVKGYKPILPTDPDDEKITGMFAPELMISLNVAPVHIWTVRLWGFAQRELDDLLIVADESWQQIERIVMMDLSDFRGFPEHSLAKFRAVRLSLGTGEVVEGSKQTRAEIFSGLSEKEQKKLTRLIVQCKFIAGHLFYRGQEKDELVSWLGELVTSGAWTPQQIRDFFKGHILYYKVQSRRHFGESDIKKVIDQLQIRK